MLYLLKHCHLAITDSGGLQKEAFFMSKPCVTVREQTEWVELIDQGVNILAGANYQNIRQYTELMLNKKLDFSMNLYGNGKAGNKIIAELIKAV